jgi:hypothetical protein
MESRPMKVDDVGAFSSLVPESTPMIDMRDMV